YLLGRNRSVGGVALADLDFDGDLDVLATIAGNNGQFNQLALWRNQGDGTLAPQTEFTAGPGPIGLVVADFTGDGFPDVVTADYGRGFGAETTVSLLAHNGQAGDAAGFLPPVAFPVGPYPRQLAVADVNGDGRLDLAVGRGRIAYPGSGTRTILLGDGA